MPLVSVLMPSYNHDKYISDAIESVLNQTFNDLELIIIDDASEDNSKDIIKDYQKRDKRIRVFFHEKNLGITKTVNEIIDKSRGTYIAFFSSDDLFVEDKLEKQIKILENNENLIVHHEGIFMDSFGNSNGKLLNQSLITIKRSGNIFEELILKHNFIFGASVIVKKDLLNNIRQNEKLKFTHDYKLWLDLAKDHEFFFIPEPLTFYRVHDTNTMKSDPRGLILDIIECYQIILEEYNDSLSNYIKNFILLTICKKYYDIGEKDKALKNITIALSNPREYNIFYLLAVFVIHISNKARWTLSSFRKD